MDQNPAIEAPPTVNPAEEASRVEALKQAFLSLQERWKAFRVRQYRNYEYVAGNMLDPEVRSALEEDGRPIFEFQIPNQTVLYLAGKLKRDRTKMKAEPISGGDENLTPLITTLVNDWAMEGCQGYNEMARAGLDASIGGIGFVSNYYDVSEDPEGKWWTTRLDPFLTMFDPNCKRIDQRDCNYVCYSPMLSVEEIISTCQAYIDEGMAEELREAARRYEGTKVTYFDKARSWFDRLTGSTTDTATFDSEREARIRKGLLNDFLDAKEGLYRFIEWHDRRTITEKFIYSPYTRETVPVPAELEANKEALAALLASIPGGTMQTITKKVLFITIAVPALLPSKFLAERPYAVQGKGYSIKWTLCYDFHPDQTRCQSILDSLIAPTDFTNQRLSTSLEISMDAVNPPIDAPVGSIDDVDLPDWRSKKRGLLRFYKANAAGTKPERVAPQTDAFQMLKVLSDEGRDLHEYISGISPNARGYQESAGESGKLFNARQAQSEVMVSHFFDNVQEMMRQVFSFTFRSLQTYVTFPRLVRILNEEDEPMWIMLNLPTLTGIKNDISIGEYDFKPDMQALGETQRKETIALLGEASQMLTADPIAQMHVAAVIFKYLGIPEGKEISRGIMARMGMQAQTAANQAALATAGAQVDLLGKAIQTVRPPEAKPAKKAG